MNLHNISVISRYEAKLLRRSWLFRIFAILALLIITNVHLLMQSNLNNWVSWSMISMPAAIPFMNTYIYNIFQSIIAIFLAGSFLKRDQKLDTAEVIYVHPMSNADYILGKTWGIVKVFIGLNIITLCIAGFINVFVSDAPFNFLPYVFYLVTLSVPSLIFILGLSFMVMSFIKNQAVTFVIMLGYIVFSLYFLSDYMQGAFDFFALSLSNMFSDVVGHVNLIPYITQRIFIFIFGLSLLVFTVSLVKRLPLHPKKNVLLVGIGIVLLFVSLSFAFSYISDYESTRTNRSLYVDKFKKYNSFDKVNTQRQSIVFAQESDLIKATSTLSLVNNNFKDLNKIILYLNPLLNINSIKTLTGEDVSYERDEQVIILNTSMLANSSLDVIIDYEGGIDESICYLDIEDKEYFDTKTGNSILRFGKKYSFLQNEFTLLTPETMWYPVSYPIINPEALYNFRKDFTEYELKVYNPDDRMVISQGEGVQVGDSITFTNSTPLTGISLTIGDYEKKSISVDSVNYELFYFKGHDYFSQELQLLPDTLEYVIREFKSELENTLQRTFPFKKFALVETPISFESYGRMWKGNSENVLSEIVYLPEKGTYLEAVNFKQSKKSTYRISGGGNPWMQEQEMEEIEKEVNAFNGFLRNFSQEQAYVPSGNMVMNIFLRIGMPSGTTKPSKFYVGPQFTNHVQTIYSGEYPVINIVLDNMFKNEGGMGMMGMRFSFFSALTDEVRASEYLNGKSFEQAIVDNNLDQGIFIAMLKLKSNYLKNYIFTKVLKEDYNAFVKDFLANNKFKEIDFYTFSSEFARTFDLNLMDFIPIWYTINKTPRFLIKNADVEEVLIDDFTKYMISFDIHNPTNTDGLLTITLPVMNFRGGGMGRRGGGGFGNAQSNIYSYFIKGNEYKQVRILNDDRPFYMTINTNISQNIPLEFNPQLPRSYEETTNREVGLIDIDPIKFGYDPKEIIVDNEDPGFKIIESNQKNKLQDIFRSDSEDKYKPFNYWNIPTRWTLTLNNDFYGEYIKSGYYKRSGAGNNLAEWSANIENAGYYEIYAYTVTSMMGRLGRRRDFEQKNFQYYTVYSDEGEDVVEVEIDPRNSGWFSLGKYYLSKGEAKVVLSDKGSDPNMVINADAIKWVFLDKN